MPARKESVLEPVAVATGIKLGNSRVKNRRRAATQQRESLALEAIAAPLSPGYDVRIVPADVPAGQTWWKIVEVRHLTPEENDGRHNLFADVLDESGVRDRNAALRLVWTWDGRRLDELAPPKSFDKPDTEPATNIDLYMGQRVAAWVEGDGLLTDRVENIHTNHPDERAANGALLNTIGHHSFHVTFQRTVKTLDAAASENGGVTHQPEPAPTGAFKFVAWPTEYRVITQAFGANPHLYEEFLLPGHEGIDIRATSGSRIYSVAPGRVSFVQNFDSGAYGIHVRIAHQDGYETIYAHMLRLDVSLNQNVEGGQVLGLADNTGNSFGDHLHLTLKHAGESFGGYPHNIIDPTPFLAPLLGGATDYAIYLSDLVADGTKFNANASFVQRWNMRNDGQTTWKPGYMLALVGGNFPNAPAAMVVPTTAPGGVAALEATFRAPSSPGRYRAEYSMINLEGHQFGHRVWVEIEVTGAVVTPEVPATTAPRDRLGIDVNAPIGASGEIAQRILNPENIVALGVGWVRVNFILGPWNSVTDTTLHNGRTWQQTYGEVIRILRDAGVRIYALVGHEAVREDALERFRDEIFSPSQDGWINAYAETFAQVARMFHDQVDAFESFNEPDNWRNTGHPLWKRNWIHSSWFAVMLQEIHQRVRGDATIRHIKIISGPVQGLDISNNAGVTYLANACAKGKEWYGWGVSSAVPFDGIGYHLYLAQDPGVSDAGLRGQLNQYMAQMRALAGSLGGKPIYVSEIGWQSVNGEEKQRERMQTSLGFLVNDAAVACTFWFCLQDWSEKWGLTPEGEVSPNHRKQAFATLNAISKGVGTPLPAMAAVPAPSFAPLPLMAELQIANEGPVSALHDRLLVLVDTLIDGAAANPESGVKLALALAGMHLVLRGYDAQVGGGAETAVVTQAAIDQIAALLEAMS